MRHRIIATCKLTGRRLGVSRLAGTTYLSPLPNLTTLDMPLLVAEEVLASLRAEPVLWDAGTFNESGGEGDWRLTGQFTLTLEPDTLSSKGGIWS